MRSSRGVQLFTCGWLPAAASPKALVFLCHGSNQATPLQAAALHALLSLAVSCFSYYYTCYLSIALVSFLINSSFGYYSFSLRWCRFSPQATAWSAVAS